MLILFVFFACNGSSKTEISTEEEKAIKLAEDFIKRNAYTDALLDTSEYKLVRELNDWSDNDSVILKNRRGMLLPKAYGITTDIDSKWLVAFCNCNVSDEKNSCIMGRGVIVSKDGKEVRIAHKPVGLSHLKKNIK
ncbi:MAG: hypothetical protein IAF38_05815 [Bacteroidia bacterium]|nr:hypothetical protein [Bacteroidia bacterium]